MSNIIEYRRELGTRWEYKIITDENDEYEKVLCRFCNAFVRIWVEGEQCDTCRLVYCDECQKQWVKQLNNLGYNVHFDTFLSVKAFEDCEQCYEEFCPFCILYSKNGEELRLMSDILNLNESKFK
jgi:hypothetical protein